MKWINTTVFSAAVLTLLIANGAMAQSMTVYGQAQKLGNGFAQPYAELDAKGAPRVLGISFDGGLLENLPAKMNNYSRCFDKNGNGKIDATGECNGGFELAFPVPSSRARSSWSQVPEMRFRAKFSTWA